MKPPALPPPSLRHPGRWIWLLLLVPLVLGLARLRFDVEVFDLLPSNLPVVTGLKLYQEHFANARELIITLQADKAEQAENASRRLAESLRAHPEYVAPVTWEPPWLEHPDQSAELLAYLWFNQPPQAFEGLKQRLAPDKLSSVLTAAREELTTSMSPGEIARLSYDPYGLTRLPESVAEAAPAFGQGQEMFSSSDGSFRILFVQARNELRSYRDCEAWLRSIKALASDALEGDGGLAGVTLGYTGRPAFVAEVASGMERDMTISVGGTAAIIAFLFWLAHRRIKPMLWLLTLLALILGSTLALGGLIFGSINVVSIGFAAILLGLAVDYAVVHYQEALAHPGLTIGQVRHAIAPSIFWAAVTTIAAFLVLNLGGLPGLAQLGTLVGVGVALAALIMIFEFLPPLFPDRDEAKTKSTRPVNKAPENEVSPPLPYAGSEKIVYSAGLNINGRPQGILVFGITAALVLFTGAVLLFGLPTIDSTANALRPRNSPAYAAMEQIQTHLAQKHEPLWLVLGGPTLTNVAETMMSCKGALALAASNGVIAGFTLPTELWPKPGFQAANRTTARELSGERTRLRRAAQESGFTETSLALTERILETWQVAAEMPDVFWPTNPMSQWIFSKVTARTPTNFFALGFVHASKSSTAEPMQELQDRLPRGQVWLSGWQLLGHAIFAKVQANLWKVLGPMVILVLLSLFLAFRRAEEIVLSLAVLLLSAFCLLTVMRLAGWSWNLLNLMAIPLVLGTGVDYSIFMQLALRRFGGDLGMAYRSVGRALLLCGGTAIAGFGSLGFSSNTGMASLGKVCAVGVGSNMLIAIFLLPTWWTIVRRRTLSAKGHAGTPEEETLGGVDSEPGLSTPSSLYRRRFWELGLGLVKYLPSGLCARLSRVFVGLYWALAPHRRRVVVENLLPAVKGDVQRARQTAKALFRQFAMKVVDLWRYEAGLGIDGLFGETTGWEHFVQAQSQKRGVLLLTPHLGNWEFGGPLLTRRGVALQVLTLAEPGKNFTELRQASRARWNVETLVIGNDPLAFVEIIRRLEDGATVALLIDRPPPATAITVRLFDQPFAASIAAAELARASGCVLLPVYLPRRGGAYDAHILPPIPYVRATLRDRAARQDLTQRIVSVFEPLIREHLDQWYHFVPIWARDVQQNSPPP